MPWWLHLHAVQQRHPAHAAAGVGDPLVQETPGQTLPLLRAQHPAHRGGSGRAQGGARQQHAPVDGDLLQVEQHGAGVGPEPPGALLGQGVAGGAPGHCTCSLHLAGSAPHLHAVPGPNMCARPNL